MEKIQSAIAKARAARGEQAKPAADAAQGAVAAPSYMPAPQQPAAAPPTMPAAAVPPKPGAVDAAWAGLQIFSPNAVHMARNRVVAFEGGREAAAFDVMRTRLLQQMRANNWRRVAITSPGAHCGKSTITLNLGFSLARQTETRTVIAELDLRRPSLARILGLKTKQYFSSVLAGTADFADNVLRYGDNLALATNASPLRNSAELLNGSTVAPALRAIEARYDPAVMIFDLPPMLVSDDTMAFMGHVDCVLLVAAAESTTIKEIDVCERDLATQTNVLGVVLNKCRYTGQDYSYYT